MLNDGSGGSSQRYNTIPGVSSCAFRWNHNRTANILYVDDHVEKHKPVIDGYKSSVLAQGDGLVGYPAPMY